MHDQMDSVVGRSLLGIGGVSDAFLDELIRRIAQGDIVSADEALTAVRSAVQFFEPLLADHLSDAVLAGWITGYDNVAGQLPPWVQQEFTDTIRRQPPGEPPIVSMFGMFEREPELRLINTENAAKRLLERNIMTRDQFDEAREDAKRQAFTIAGDLGDQTIERMRHFLYQDLAQGTSLAGFENIVRDHLGQSPIAPGHLENVYRTNLQAAYRDGRETLRSNPIVAATFPYQEYIPVHDARARHNHRAMGHLGLNGTGIYRADDPIWDRWTPPAGFNCRCGVRLLTLDQAAAAGVREAIEWLETGRPPLHPEYRNALVDIDPTPGFGHRGNVGAIVMSIDANGREHKGKGPDGGQFVSERVDQAVVNVPLSKRGNIDAQLDRFKSQQSKDAKRTRSSNAVKARIAKSQAQELFRLHGKGLADATAAKHGVNAKEALATLNSLVKWEPEKALALLEKHEQQIATELAEVLPNTEVLR